MKLELVDSGAPRGERRWWAVVLNGVTVFESTKQATAEDVHYLLEKAIKKEARKEPEQVIPARSETLDRLKYFYMRPDGTYDFPNSAAGDVLKIAKREIESLLRQPDHAEALANALEEMGLHFLLSGSPWDVKNRKLIDAYRASKKGEPK